MSLGEQKRIKIHVSSYILRRPQNVAKSSPYFWLAVHRRKVRWRFHKVLWPSQDIWVLIIIANLLHCGIRVIQGKINQGLVVKIGCPSVTDKQNQIFFFVNPCQKVPNLDFQNISMPKIIRTLLKRISVENKSLGQHFLLKTFFCIFHFNTALLIKSCLFFDKT